MKKICTNEKMTASNAQLGAMKQALGPARQHTELFFFDKPISQGKR